MMPKKKKSEVQTVPCFICDKVVEGENIEDVMMHIQEQHLKTSKTGVLTLKCLRLHCRKIFDLNNDSISEIKAKTLEMVDHQIRVHREERPAYLPINSCEICRFWSYVPEVLGEHMKVKHNVKENILSCLSGGKSIRDSEAATKEKDTLVKHDGVDNVQKISVNHRKRKLPENCGGATRVVVVSKDEDVFGVTKERLPMNGHGCQDSNCDELHNKARLITDKPKSQDVVVHKTVSAASRSEGNELDSAREMPHVNALRSLGSNGDKKASLANVSESQNRTKSVPGSGLDCCEIPANENDQATREFACNQETKESQHSCEEQKSKSLAVSKVQEDNPTKSLAGELIESLLTVDQIEEIQKSCDQENSGNNNNVPNSDTVVAKRSTCARRTTLKVFQCFLCRPWIIFNSYASLRQHFSKTHFQIDGKLLTLSCPECLDVFSSKARGDKHLILSVAQHMHEVHHMAAPEFLTSGLVVCSECTVWTMAEAHMKTHALNHLDSDVDVKQTSYDCFLCNTKHKHVSWPDFRDHFTQEHVVMDEGAHYGVSCPFCQKFISFNNQQVTWSSLVALAADHMIKLHHMTLPSFVTRYTCTKCDFSTLLRRSFTGHQIYHDRTDKTSEGNKAAGMTFECFMCPEVHYSWADLVAHFKAVHFSIENKEVLLTCPECNVSLTFLGKKYSPFGVYMTRLVQHMIGKHMITKPAYIKEFICEPCSYITVVQDNYRAHVKQHDKIKKDCPNCFIVLSPSGLWRHMKVCPALGLQEPHLVCTQCNATFSREYQLKQHKAKVHSTESRYRCTRCEKSFYRKDGLVMHLFNDHGENPECRSLVRCIHCSFVTLYDYNLKDHVKKMHTVGHFPCMKCGKAFQKYYAYNKHVCLKKEPHQEFNIVVPESLFTKIKLEGNGEEFRFFCKFCSYSTTYKICLQVHLKTMHSTEWHRGKAVDPVTSDLDQFTPNPIHEVVVETNENQVQESVIDDGAHFLTEHSYSEEDPAMTVLHLQSAEEFDAESVVCQVMVPDDNRSTEGSTAESKEILKDVVENASLATPTVTKSLDAKQIGVTSSCAKSNMMSQAEEVTSSGHEVVTSSDIMAPSRTIVIEPSHTMMPML